MGKTDQQKWEPCDVGNALAFALMCAMGIPKVLKTEAVKMRRNSSKLINMTECKQQKRLNLKQLRRLRNYKKLLNV